MKKKAKYTKQDFTFDYINRLGFNDICVLDFPIRPVKYQKIFGKDLARDVLNRHGVKVTDKVQGLNSYLGHLQHFSWLSASHRRGAFMTDLNFIIDEITERYPQYTETVETIKRRLVYLNYCEEELKYILKTYILEGSWKNYVISKMEAYVSMGAEVLMQLADFYIVKILNVCESKELRFETFLYKLKEANQDTNKYLSELLYCFILFQLRNRISHTAYNYFNFQKDTVYIQMENVDVNMNYFNMDIYLDDLISRYNGKKVGGYRVTVQDPHFTFLKATLRVGKKGEFIKKETKFSVNMDLERLFELRHFLIYHLLRDTIRTHL